MYLCLVRLNEMNRNGNENEILEEKKLKNAILSELKQDSGSFSIDHSTL